MTEGSRRETVERKFNNAIYGLFESQVPDIDGLARRVEQRIRTGEIMGVASSKRFFSPATTGFDFLHVPQASQVLFNPVIVVDPEKMLSDNPDKIQADMIRTLALADQFPHNGYQRRYRESYADALK